MKSKGFRGGEIGGWSRNVFNVLFLFSFEKKIGNCLLLSTNDKSDKIKISSIIIVIDKEKFLGIKNKGLINIIVNNFFSEIKILNTNKKCNY